MKMYRKCFDKITNSDAPCVRRLEDEALIPFDPANTDYQAYLKWVSDGNTPLPAEEGNNTGATQ